MATFQLNSNNSSLKRSLKTSKKTSIILIILDTSIFLPHHRDTYIGSHTSFKGLKPSIMEEPLLKKEIAEVTSTDMLSTIQTMDPSGAVAWIKIHSSICLPLSMRSLQEIVSPIRVSQRNSYGRWKRSVTNAIIPQERRIYVLSVTANLKTSKK